MKYNKDSIWKYFKITEEDDYTEATEKDILKLGAEIMRLNERIIKLEHRKK